MKLFISYNHADKDYIEKFIKQMTVITGEDKLIKDIWYDRDIAAGDDFWNRINENLANRDIICLFISTDYLASKSCKEEMTQALKRREDEGVLVIPIILRPCAWQDVNSLSSILAATTDGRPISDFDNEDNAWMDVYKHVKKAVEQYSKIRQISLNGNFVDFLNDATAFTKSNPNKNKLVLDDIFVYPDLDKVEKDCETKRISSNTLINNYQVGDRFVIVGEDQSGKTSLLKKYIQILRSKGFYPIYVKDSAELLQGDFSYRIGKLFNEQYCAEVELSDVYQDKIVPVVDDFHKAKNKTKILQSLLAYKGCIIVVDDIYTIDAQNNILALFERYEIKQLKYSQRIELIQKWLLASELPKDERLNTNDELKKVDEKSAVIENTLGKVLGKSIMPSYAYFILTLLVLLEDNDRPIEEKITSQGHCYQALIVLFLKKQGVSSSPMMDSYINFLTEFALRIYKNHGQALSSIQFEDFVNEYKKIYSLVDSLQVMLEKLVASNIIVKTSLGNYEFTYPYIYYFFAGKFFAQTWEDENDPSHKYSVEQITTILDNLHKTSNAYIAVFTLHHTKNTALIRKIEAVAKSIFQKFKPATMDKQNLSVFTIVEDRIKAPLLNTNSTPVQNRAFDSQKRDRIELQQENEVGEDIDDSDSEFTLDLRRSIKTVEVLGSIIKNRVGSLRREQVEDLFAEAMDIQLRLVSCFLDIVNSITQSSEGTKFLETRIKEVHPDIDPKELPVRAKALFWSMNFGFLICIIKKTAFSLGSSALARTARSVCEARNTPAAFLIKHTIQMWFVKNVDINELQKMDKVIDCKTAKNVMLWLVSDYCRVHHINYKDAAKLEKIGIKRLVLLPSPEKNQKILN